MFFCFQAAQIPAKKAQSEANVSVCSEVSLIILIKFYFLLLFILAYTENYFSCNHQLE